MKMKGKEKLKDLFQYRDISNWSFGAVIVGLIILSLVIMLLLPFSINPIGRRGATIRSNSMEPTFSRGDVVFLQEADPQEVEEGDVIALAVPERWQQQHGYPEIVVHRVIEVEEDEDTGRIRFRTQGDAEDNEDPFLTPSENVVGKYTGTSIPQVGLVFLFANTLVGMTTLSLVFILFVIAVYFPWHIDKKEERYEAMSTLGSGVTSLHRRLNEIQEAMGDTASAVGESVSGLMVSRTADGNIASIRRESKDETRPENIMMKREDSELEDKDLGADKPIKRGEVKKEGKRKIDLRPLDELHKEFQKGELSIDEFIDMRKDASPEKESGEKEVDLRPLNELHKKFQREEISVQEFIELRKELMGGGNNG